MTSQADADQTTQDLRAATDAGMNAFRRELEDENQHIDDAVRIGIQVGIIEHGRRALDGLTPTPPAAA